MKLEGTKTLENLKEAFAGEAQAHTKYQYYASQAKKDGYVQLQHIFEETSRNEKEHAKIWFKLMFDGMPTTVANLKDCIAGEHYEHSDMYVRMAQEAREEGFDDIAGLFDGVAAIEKEHEERYKKFLDNIEQEIVFKRDEEVVWICQNCGYIHVGKEAPEMCPVCDHPKDHFMIRAENY